MKEDEEQEREEYVLCQKGNKLKAERKSILHIEEVLFLFSKKHTLLILLELLQLHSIYLCFLLVKH